MRSAVEEALDTVDGATRLVVMPDYDDSLEKRPEVQNKDSFVRPNSARLDVLDTPASPDTRSLLIELNDTPEIDLIVNTGRDADTFEHLVNGSRPQDDWFRPNIIAEFGVVLRPANSINLDDSFIIVDPGATEKVFDTIPMADFRVGKLEAFTLKYEYNDSLIGLAQRLSTVLRAIIGLQDAVESTLNCPTYQVQRVVVKQTIVAANCAGFVDEAERRMQAHLNTTLNGTASSVALLKGAKWLDVMMAAPYHNKAIGTAFALRQIKMDMDPQQAYGLKAVLLGDSRPDGAMFEQAIMELGRENVVNMRVGKTPLPGETLVVEAPEQARDVLRRLRARFVEGRQHPSKPSTRFHDLVGVNTRSK
ncbi:MAG: hypothetical protein EYC62_06330 [Alphaproteobacteria bacterium]|nr:MAG: hypothetical protein EYC62_06330 [Alphaproteobacteria bacterium]